MVEHSQVGWFFVGAQDQEAVAEVVEQDLRKTLPKTRRMECLQQTISPV